MTARRSCVAVRVRKKGFGSGFVNHFADFVIRVDSDIFKITETNAWGRFRNTNNFTVPESF